MSSPGARRQSSRWPTPLLMLLDAAVLVVVIAVLAAARYDMTLSTANREGMAMSMALGFGVYVATYGLVVARRARWASPDEVAGLAMVALCLTACLTAAAVLTQPALLPLSVALTAAPTAMTLWGILRYVATRFHRARIRRGLPQAQAAVVVGAGLGGQQAVAMMRDDPRARLRPVAIVDDDPSKRHLSIHGVRVRGTVESLPEIVTQTEAAAVVLAAPSASPAFVNRVIELATSCGAEVLVLPPLDELLARAPQSGSADGSGVDPRGRIEITRQAFRPVALEDLLGRGTADIDAAHIGDYLRDKVILVTGAGGSIGGQLCREIAQFEPRRLVMTDRDDSLLHAVQLTIDGRGLLDDANLVLGDLRRPGFAAQLVDDVRPDVVFHAAAIKHLTLAERFPTEAFLTNVCVTIDLLQACAEAGVTRFVNISTDKAADPTSVLGYTKRITERITASVGSSVPDGRYLSVRFGNVLGSRGSALTTFALQLSTGQPLTITDPEMERFFMSTHEACRLVLQAAADGRSGEGLVLDMGEPHNIEQIARRFAALQGYPEPRIVYTGVRDAEKLSERTLAHDEVDERPFHPLISRVKVPPLDASALQEISWWRQKTPAGVDAEALRTWLSSTAATRPAEASPAPAAPPTVTHDPVAAVQRRIRLV